MLHPALRQFFFGVWEWGKGVQLSVHVWDDFVGCPILDIESREGAGIPKTTDNIDGIESGIAYNPQFALKTDTLNAPLKSVPFQD